MPSPTHAALAGFACGLRSFATPAALAARGHITGPLRTATLVVAAGELVADKLPLTPARTEPGPLFGRVVSGTLCGRALAGNAGAVAGAAGALAGAFAGQHARALVVGATGGRDPAIAVGEDVLAYLIAAAATR